MRRPIEVDIEEEIHQTAQQAKQGFRSQLLLLLLVVLAFPLLSLLWGGGPAIDWQEDRLILIYPDKTTAGFAYADVSAIEYREGFDFGSPATGGRADGFRYGLWNNEEFGDYQTYCQEDISNCIILTVSGIQFVINFESQESTQSLYESVRGMLEEKGHLQQ